MLQRDRLSNMGGFIGSWLEEWMDGMSGWYLFRTDERHQFTDSVSAINYHQDKHILKAPHNSKHILGKLLKIKDKIKSVNPKGNLS